jgi:ATP-dependent Zn protease
MGTDLASQRLASDTPSDFASEATRRLRDQEQRALTEEAQRAAYALLGAHRPLLEELARTLLANEALEREDIERIFGDTPRAERTGGTHLRIAAAQPPAPESPKER